MTRRGAKFADTTTAFLNMKNLALPLLLLFCVGLNAQNLPKKYVLLEHFTNSKCPICASKNPAFYNLIANYPDDVHHIAYHPPIPYNTCVFYLDNPTENSGRASVYSINGTPRVALNGSLAPVSGALLQQALLTAEIGETSPLSLRWRKRAIRENVPPCGPPPSRPRRCLKGPRAGFAGTLPAIRSR